MRGKVEVEIFRAWDGCRWNWDVWIDKRPIGSGVEDTYDQAATQARRSVDAHVNIYEGSDDD